MLPSHAIQRQYVAPTSNGLPCVWGVTFGCRRPVRRDLPIFYTYKGQLSQTQIIFSLKGTYTPDLRSLLLLDGMQHRNQPWSNTAATLLFFWEKLRQDPMRSPVFLLQTEVLSYKLQGVCSGHIPSSITLQPNWLYQDCAHVNNNNIPFSYIHTHYHCITRSPGDGQPSSLSSAAPFISFTSLLSTLLVLNTLETKFYSKISNSELNSKISFPVPAFYLTTPVFLPQPSMNRFNPLPTLLSSSPPVPHLLGHNESSTLTPSTSWGLWWSCRYVWGY